MSNDPTLSEYFVDPSVAVRRARQRERILLALGHLADALQAEPARLQPLHALCLKGQGASEGPLTDFLAALLEA